MSCGSGFLQHVALCLLPMYQVLTTLSSDVFPENEIDSLSRTILSSHILSFCIMSLSSKSDHCRSLALVVLEHCASILEVTFFPRFISLLCFFFLLSFRSMIMHRLLSLYLSIKYIFLFFLWSFVGISSIHQFACLIYSPMFST